MDFSVEEIKNLSSLLLSKDDTNTALAFEMMKGKNASKKLLTELFAVCKLTTDAHFRTQAQNEIQAIASPQTIALLDSKKKLSRSSTFDPNEKTIAKNITYYVSASLSELDGIKLAKALIEKYGHGYEYLINHSSSDELITFFAQFQEGNKWVFRKKGIGKIPKEVFLIPNAEQIEEFDMSGNKIATLPTGIAKFKHLKRINLSGNNLKSINKSIGKLKALTELDLSHNNFKKFPEAILQCPLIVFKGSHMASYFSRVFQLPAEFAQMTTLRELHLHRSNTHSMDNMHDVLGQSKQLELVVLSAYHETPEQIKTLQKLLPNCTVTTDKLLSQLNKN